MNVNIRNRKPDEIKVLFIFIITYSANYLITGTKNKLKIHSTE